MRYFPRFRFSDPLNWLGLLLGLTLSAGVYVLTQPTPSNDFSRTTSVLAPTP
jgi:hypothetical protein